MRARARAGWAAGVAGEGNTAVREVPRADAYQQHDEGNTRGEASGGRRCVGGGCGDEEAAAKRAAKRAVRARR